MSNKFFNNKRMINRVLVIMLCLVLLILSTNHAYAINELYETDPYTNEVVSNISGTSTVETNTKRLSNNCSFDLNKKVFMYYVGNSTSSYLTSTVYDNEYVSDDVTIDTTNAGNIIVYCDGELVEGTDIYNLEEPGCYIVKNGADEETIFSFEIVPDYTNNINRFEVPSIFYIVTAYIDDEKIPTGNLNYVRLEQEGTYLIKYTSSLGISRNVKFTIDRTAPILEISGVEDGYANGPITIGEREDGSSLQVLINGDEVSVNDKYTSPGTYHMIYSDKAGNMSSYDFTIKMYLNISAGLVIGIVAAIAIAILVYMIYLRKHMRTY